MVFEQVPTLVRMIFHLDQSYESFMIRATGSHFHVDTVHLRSRQACSMHWKGGGSPFLEYISGFAVTSEQRSLNNNT